VKKSGISEGADSLLGRKSAQRGKNSDSGVENRFMKRGPWSSRKGKMSASIGKRGKVSPRGRCNMQLKKKGDPGRHSVPCSSKALHEG